MGRNDLVDIHNVITPKDLETLLTHQVNRQLEQPELAKALPPLMVWGAPGLGKSTILRRVAQQAGIGFIDVRLAQREPVDVRGLPVPDNEHNQVRWLVSADWPRDPDSKGILLFDELTAADRSLQVAAYELILDRRLGDLYQVPDGWYICAAGNRVEDNAVATTMSSALANRFLHVELQENVEDWIAWGLRNNIHPAVLGFLRYQPDMLCRLGKENLERGWPSPRSWERVSTMLHTFPDASPHMLHIIVSGLVGTGAAVEFLAFKQISDEFTNVHDLMTNPKAELKIPTKPDRKYAFCAAVSYHVWRGRDEKEAKTLLDGFYRIALAISSDFSALLMVDALQGGQNIYTMSYCSHQLHQHPQYKAWSQKHGKAMRATVRL